MSALYAGVNVEHGAPLRPIAEYYQSRGWQLVPCRWHRSKNGKAGDTPISGVTGSAPFLPASRACPAGLTLHPEGGPETEQGTGAKPAVRPPATVIGIDVDHGYGGKTGGDTLVNAEMALGPLPGSYSLTARGPFQPSRRIWYRKPADLILKDDFFREFGGFIEIIRTGHRYSWTWPAVHAKRGRVIGPVLWYDDRHDVVGLPHIDDLSPLPDAWVKRGYELMAAYVAKTRPVEGAPGQATGIKQGHADAVVAKLVAKFMGPPDLRGGDFRNVLFGLTKVITQRALARGHGEREVHNKIRELFVTHPWRGTPNDRDVQWIDDGIRKGTEAPWVFTLETYTPDGYLSPECIAAIWETYPVGVSASDAAFRDDLLNSGRQRPSPEDGATIAAAIPEPRTGATDDELQAFLDTFTRSRDLVRLSRRTQWMRADVRQPRRMAVHARALVTDAIAGHYSATKAVAALVAVYRGAGCRDPAVPRRVLAAALDTVLNAKVPA